MSEQAKPSLIGDRLVVTGMAGAGKSTLARRLAQKTGLPLIHLDLHSWKPGWVRVPAAEIVAKARVLRAEKHWLVDSNGIAHDILVTPANTLIILATPLVVLCLAYLQAKAAPAPANATTPW